MSALTELEVVRVENVSKRFLLNKERSLKNRLIHPKAAKASRVDFWALQDVSVSIPAGTTVGLIGPNGSGKSTLLKIIGSIIEPTTGSVSTRGRLAALLELGTGFHPDLTGRENIYLNAAVMGLTKEETDAHFDEIVEFSGLQQFIDTQVKFYSSGMYVRLAFSVSIHVDPDILLVDEVLAVGDEAFQQKCLEKIREFQKQGRTIFFVSHSMDQVTSLCTRALLLDHGKVVFDGDPSEAVEQLRLGFQESGQMEPGKIDVQEGQALIHAVRVRTDEGGPVVPGSDLTVDVDISCGKTLKGWDLELHILNTLGSTMLSTSATQAGLETDDLPRKARVRFALPNVCLGAGGYAVTASLFDQDRNNIAHADAATYFVVETPGLSSGPVYAAVSAQVRSLEEPVDGGEK